MVIGTSWGKCLEYANQTASTHSSSITHSSYLSWRNICVCSLYPTYTNVTIWIQELRAASKHVEHPDIPVSELTSQERIALQLRLYQAVQDVEECSICFNSLENPRILPCTHYFCLSCITEVCFPFPPSWLSYLSHTLQVISRQQLCPMVSCLILSTRSNFTHRLLSGPSYHFNERFAGTSIASFHPICS